MGFFREDITEEKLKNLFDKFCNSYRKISDLEKGTLKWVDEAVFDARRIITNHLKENFSLIEEGEQKLFKQFTSAEIIPAEYQERNEFIWQKIVSQQNLRMPGYEPLERHENEHYIASIVESMKAYMEVVDDYDKKDWISFLSLYDLRANHILIYNAFKNILESEESREVIGEYFCSVIYKARQFSQQCMKAKNIHVIVQTIATDFFKAYDEIITTCLTEEYAERLISRLSRTYRESSIADHITELQAVGVPISPSVSRSVACLLRRFTTVGKKNCARKEKFDGDFGAEEAESDGEFSSDEEYGNSFGKGLS